MVQGVDLLFVHLVHDAHVLAQSVVLFFEKAVLLLEFDVTVE